MDPQLLRLLDVMVSLTSLGMRINQATVEANALVQKSLTEGRDLTDAEIEHVVNFRKEAVEQFLEAVKKRGL